MADKISFSDEKFIVSIVFMVLYGALAYVYGMQEIQMLSGALMTMLGYYFGSKAGTVINNNAAVEEEE